MEASWLAAWETLAAPFGMDPNHPGYWQTGGDWIETERRPVR